MNASHKITCECGATIRPKFKSLPNVGDTLRLKCRCARRHDRVVDSDDLLIAQLQVAKLDVDRGDLATAHQRIKDVKARVDELTKGAR